MSPDGVIGPAAIIAVLVVVAVVVVAAVVALRRPAAAPALRQAAAVIIRPSRWYPYFSVDAESRALTGDPAAAFAALERIGSEMPWRPELRPDAVAMLCHHLRDVGPTGHREVTAAVQQQLEQLLRPSTPGGRRRGVSVDLHGAQLGDLDLTGAVVDQLDLRAAEFTGTTRLTGLRCAGTIDCSGGVFETVLADRAHAAGDLMLTGAAVVGDLDLAGAFVQGRLDMTEALVVSGAARLHSTVLLCATLGSPDRPGAHFEQTADLTELVCSDLTLLGTEFSGGVVLTADQTTGAQHTIHADDPALAHLVCQAAHYDLGDAAANLRHAADQRARRSTTPPAPV